MQNHILSIILFTPLVGALVLLFVPKENKDAIRWIANFFALAGPSGFAAAGADVLGAALRARLQVHRGRAEQLDSLDRRGLRAGHRRHFVPADHAHHAAGMDLDSLVVDRDRESREGILHLVSGSADGHARRLHGARFLPLLRFLGSDAGADVPADRHLGRPAQALRRDQILPVHAGRFGADAAGHSVSVLPSSRGDRRLHVQPAGALSRRRRRFIPTTGRTSRRCCS